MKKLCIAAALSLLSCSALAATITVSPSLIVGNSEPYQNLKLVSQITGEPQNTVYAYNKGSHVGAPAVFKLNAGKTLTILAATIPGLYAQKTVPLNCHYTADNSDIDIVLHVTGTYTGGTDTRNVTCP